MNPTLSKLIVPAAALIAFVVGSVAVAAEPRTYTERVHFPKGAIKTVLSGSLGPGEARNYLLGARDQQFLTVSLLPGSPNPGLHFNVFVPGGSLLYESAKGGSNQNQYKGQLYKNGDHTVTVYNVGNRAGAYEIEIVIESPASAAAPAHASGTPSRAEQACLAAVSRETREPDVTILSSEFSQANSLVMVGVGAQRAPWRCLVSNAGKVAEISFAGSEGRL